MEDEEYLDPDDVGLRDSPPPKPMKVNLQPSPSPPPASPLPLVSPGPSPGPPDRKGSHQTKYLPSVCDAVIVSSMAGGKHSDIARDAGDKPLAWDNEEGEEPVKKPEVEEEEKGQEKVVKDKAITGKNGFDLAALAVEALRQTANGSSKPARKEALAAISMSKLSTSYAGDPMEELTHTIPSTLCADKSGSQSLPDAAIRHEMSPAVGKLPPTPQYSLQSASFNENGTGSITLPSISEQLGDINHLNAAAAAEDSDFSKFRPSRPSPWFSAVLGHTSLGKLPNKTFCRESPSIGRRHLDLNVKTH